MAHLVEEGELLQGAVLPHGSNGQVFGTSEFHFLLWRETLCCEGPRDWLGSARDPCGGNL